VRTFNRFAVTVLVAGAGLALGILLLAPEVRALASAGRSGGDDLGELNQLAQRSVVLARDGSTLAVLHAEENRSPVELKDVPDHVVQAILAVEDDRFWDHGGVDLRATARALFTNVSSGELRQGGSTITQQLVKNSLLTPEKTAGRKFKEAVLAVRVENEMSKEEILERYLNTVFFGNGAYGVQAAAETYFGKDAKNLTKGQAAFLAGVIRNPIGYDPVKFPERAEQRRNVAVDQMVAAGNLTKDEAVRIKRQKLPTQPAAPLTPPDDHFVEAVKQVLLDDERLGETPQERYNAVFKGGLRITTTLDPKMQRNARAAVTKVLPDTITKGQFAAALVSVEPTTGAVRAMIGGESFEQAKFNLATQGRRQPGSSFKPFVLAAALEEGYSPNDTINGTSPCSIKQPRPLEDYEPGNYEGSAGGVMTLTEATAKSVNCAYAKLGVIVGLDNVISMAKKLGIKSPLEEVPSLSLGSKEVTPLEMASAYGVFAADGIRHEPRFIEKVVNNEGDTIVDEESDGERVISSQLARVETQVLRRVVEGGTGTRARLPNQQVAGKTGTSQEHQNAWFVGYTPQLSTAVWMGAPGANISMLNVGGIKVTGGSYPARIWREFTLPSLAGQPSRPFLTPNQRLIKAGRYIDDKDISNDGPPTSSVSGSSTTISGGNTTTTFNFDDFPMPSFPFPTSRPGQPGQPPPTNDPGGGGGGGQCPPGSQYEFPWCDSPPPGED
jgi:penicillin-binding protein 1A